MRYLEVQWENKAIRKNYMKQNSTNKKCDLCTENGHLNKERIDCVEIITCIVKRLGDQLTQNFKDID